MTPTIFLTQLNTTESSSTIDQNKPGKPCMNQPTLVDQHQLYNKSVLTRVGASSSTHESMLSHCLLFDIYQTYNLLYIIYIIRIRNVCGLYRLISIRLP